MSEFRNIAKKVVKEHEENFKRIITENLLRSKFDLIPFSKNEIEIFTRKCENGLLLEDFDDNEEKINEILEYAKYCFKEGLLEIDLQNAYFYIQKDGIKIIIYPIHKDQMFAKGDIDIYTNEITIYINDMREILKDEILITLSHELQHYFDMKEIKDDEKVKHTRANLDTDEKYYSDELEYNAMKREFLKVMEYILLKKQTKFKVNEHNKVPKEAVKSLFDLFEQGKAGVYADFFKNISYEQKQDLLNTALHKLAESLLKNNKLALKEVALIFDSYTTV